MQWAQDFPNAFAFNKKNQQSFHQCETKVQDKGATHTSSKIKTNILDNGVRYIIDIRDEGAQQSEPKRKTKVQDKEEYWSASAVQDKRAKTKVQGKGSRQESKA